MNIALFLIAQTHISKSISFQLCCQAELVCIKILPLAFHRSWMFCKWNLFVKCGFSVPVVGHFVLLEPWTEGQRPPLLLELFLLSHISNAKEVWCGFV